MNESDNKRANGFRVMPTPIPDRWPDDVGPGWHGGWAYDSPPRPSRPDPGLTEKKGGTPPSWFSPNVEAKVRQRRLRFLLFGE